MYCQLTLSWYAQCEHFVTFQIHCLIMFLLVVSHTFIFLLENSWNIDTILRQIHLFVNELKTMKQNKGRVNINKLQLQLQLLHYSQTHYTSIHQPDILTSLDKGRTASSLELNVNRVHCRITSHSWDTGRDDRRNKDHSISVAGLAFANFCTMHQKTKEHQ